MLGTLIKKEFVQLLLSFKFYVLTAVCGLTFMIMAILLAKGFDREVEDYSARVALHRTIIQDGTRLSICSRGIVVDTPLRPLQGVFSGAIKESRSIFLHSIAPIEFIKSVDEMSVSALSLCPHFTFLVTIIMTLLACILSHDLVTREKENGTLRLVFANSVPRDYVIWAKWLGNFLPLLVLFCFFFLFGLFLMDFLFILGLINTRIPSFVLMAIMRKGLST